MATIVNNPGPGNDQGSNALGWIVAIIAILVVIFLGFTFMGGRDTAPVDTNNNAQGAQPAANNGNNNGAAGNDAPDTTNVFNTTINATTTNNNSTTTIDR